MAKNVVKISHTHASGNFPLGFQSESSLGPSRARVVSRRELRKVSGKIDYTRANQVLRKVHRIH